MVDQRLLPRISEGEVRVLLSGDTCQMIIHKKPEGGLSAVGGNSAYTYYEPTDPKYSDLLAKLMKDIPSLLKVMRSPNSVTWLPRHQSHFCALLFLWPPYFVHKEGLPLSSMHAIHAPSQLKSIPSPPSCIPQYLQQKNTIAYLSIPITLFSPMCGLHFRQSAQLPIAHR